MRIEQLMVREIRNDGVIISFTGEVANRLRKERASKEA